MQWYNFDHTNRRFSFKHSNYYETGTSGHHHILTSRLKNKANKTKADVDIAAFKKQQNYVVALDLKSKCNYFNNLDANKAVKPFWKTCKPYFSNKPSRGDTSMILILKNELILKSRKAGTNFNNYFAKIVPFLNLFKWPGNVKSLPNNRGIIGSIVLKFHNHLSVKMIKNKFRKITKFSFQQVALADVRKTSW